MESKAKFLGHPVHPMLIVFPAAETRPRQEEILPGSRNR